MNITKLILSGNIKKIEKELPVMIRNMTEYCDKVLGEGVFGLVKERKYGNNITVDYAGQQNIKLPIVAKQQKKTGDFVVKKYKGKLFIYSTGGDITNEALILFMLSYVNYKKLRNPHLPIIIGVGNCGNENVNLSKNGINIIITEKQGLLKEITYTDKLFIPLFVKRKKERTSNLTTLFDFFEYVFMTKTIPTYGTVNDDELAELVDGFFIGFAFSLHFLWREYHLTLTDQHSGNIFIHFIKDSPYLKEADLYYKVKDKYLKVKQHGVVLKIGDVGFSTMIPHKNLYIFGPIFSEQKDFDISTHYKDLNFALEKETPSYVEFFSCTNMIPPHIYEKTICHKLFQDENLPFKTLRQWALTYNDLKKIPKSIDLLKLNHFDKYRVNKIDGSVNYYLIE